MITTTDHVAAGQSTLGNFGGFTKLPHRNVPHLQTSTQHPDTSLHVMSFTRLSPALILHNTSSRHAHSVLEEVVAGVLVFAALEVLLLADAYMRRPCVTWQRNWPC